MRSDANFLYAFENLRYFGESWCYRLQVFCFRVDSYIDINISVFHNRQILRSVSLKRLVSTVAECSLHIRVVAGSNPDKA